MPLSHTSIHELNQMNISRYENTNVETQQKVESMLFSMHMFSLYLRLDLAQCML